MTMLTVLLAALGLTLLFYPQLWWTAFGARQNPAQKEVPAAWVKNRRLQGGLLLAAAVVMVVVRLFQ